MNAEMQAHLDGLTERNIAVGMSPDDARHEALRTFGGVTQIAERARDEQRTLWLEQLGQDVRYAVRSLVKAPSFTITAVLTLAFGIGVNAALFSVVNMVALRPLPVMDPDSLVRIEGLNSRGNAGGHFSHAEYLVYRDSNRTLEGLLAFREKRWPLETETGVEYEFLVAGRAAEVPVELVSENYFSVLGGRIQIGRTFLPEETRFRAAPVIVLSNVFWETRLHRDPNVIGTTLTLDRRVVTVIGVASAEFSGQRPVPPAGWLPLPAWSSRPADFEAGGPQEFRLIGRLKPEITEAQAKADLDRIAAVRAREFPGDNAKISMRLDRGLRFMNLTRHPESVAFVGLVFLSFAQVLVIACTNVANLLLARGVSRQPEIGVRLTLGAGRGRIVRQLLTENLLLCVLGAALGLGLAVWTLQLLLPMIVSRLPIEWAMETRQMAFFKTTPDLRVLGFTALLTIGATLTAGLLPAWHASGASLFAVVRNDGSVFGRRFTPSRLRHLLVVVQVAVSLALLSCAGGLIRNLLGQQKTRTDYDAHGVFGISLRPNAAIADRNAAFRHALAVVRAIPGVTAVGVADPAPLYGRKQTRIRLGETEEPVNASFVSDGFFETFGIALLRGRTFRESELHSAGRAVLVSESLARRLWPGQEAVGRMLSVSDSSWASREGPAVVETFRACEVIGVAHDIMMEAGVDNRQLVYLPFPQDSWTKDPLFIRPRHVSAGALNEIVRAAKAGGVGLQFGPRHSVLVEFYLLPHYAFGVVSASLGALALGMASVGLYGLMSFMVNQRIHEIGVRMALGASGGKVVALFVSQGMRLIAIGVGLGVIGGGLFALLLEKLLHGMVDSFHPVAFGVVTFLFVLIALLACWLPARRAANVSPAVALRAE